MIVPGTLIAWSYTWSPAAATRPLRHAHMFVIAVDRMRGRFSALQVRIHNDLSTSMEYNTYVPLDYWDDLISRGKVRVVGFMPEVDEERSG